jgi:hypothetical protein
VQVQERASAAFRDDIVLIEGEVVLAKTQRALDLTDSPARPPLGRFVLTSFQIMYLPYDRTTYVRSTRYSICNRLIADPLLTE